MFTPRKCLTILIPAVLSLTACQTPPTQPDKAANFHANDTTPAPLKLTYKKGQLLTFIFITSKDGEAATTARQDYYKSALLTAQSFGLKRDATLDVKAAAVGGFKPDAIAIYSWPSEDAEAKFTEHSTWPAAKALRPKGWEDLRIATTKLEADTEIIFNPKKTYSLATAWFNPENPDHYDRYMEGIKPGVAEAGGKFVYKMFDPTYETHSAPFETPGQITLVEWDTPESLKAFGKTDAFKQNAKLLTSGTTRFEIQIVTPKT